MNEKNTVVIVTGASRGVGKGAALGLADENTIVYITGRASSDSPLPGTLDKTVQQIQQRGGQARAIYCDHSDDSQIAKMVAQVIDEQGKIDLLVNNVYQVPDDLLVWQPFWQRPLNSHWQAMMEVGLRSHYVSSCLVASHMVERQAGAIATISSPAANVYMHSVIYGMGKAAKDKMTQDMAKELREYNVAAFGLWPGIVKSERLQPLLDAGQLPAEYEALKSGMETPEFTGRILHAILAQDQAMSLSGGSWYNCELALKLGVKDADGAQPTSYAAMFGEPVVVNDVMIK